MGGTKSRKGHFQLVSCGSPLAAHAQHPDTGYQMQRFRGCFSRGEGQGKIRRFSCPSQRHPGGRGALHGPVRCQPDGVPGQQRPADQLDPLRLQHGAALGFGPLIHGEHTIGIGSRRDDRDGPAGFRQCPGQRVGPAQVAGEQRHGKPAALVQHDNGRVGGFALAVGRNGPHGDANSPHKNQGVRLCKLRTRPLRQPDTARAAAGNTAGQCPGQPVGQSHAFFCKGQIGAAHCFGPVAGRYSVAKAGS